MFDRLSLCVPVFSKPMPIPLRSENIPPEKHSYNIADDIIRGHPDKIHTKTKAINKQNKTPKDLGRI